jgi:membrane associated rhomboid family serine protease
MLHHQLDYVVLHVLLTFVVTTAAGNRSAYYWLIIQIVFAIYGSFAAIAIAFTAHIGGFIAGVILTKLFVGIERMKRAKYFVPSRKNYSTWWKE